MPTSLLKRVRGHFDRPYIERHIVRHNIRSWVASVRHLGNKWLLATPVQRKEQQ